MSSKTDKKNKKLFEILSSYPDLVIAFSAAEDGSLKLGDRPQDTARHNRERFLKKIGVDPQNLAVGGLVQGNRVQRITRKDQGRVIPNTDGMLTNENGIILSVTAADCLPVFLYDPVQQAVGMLHAGWRGLAKDIILVAMSGMKDEFGSQPRDIIVGMGPAIGPCHYEVQQEVAQEFSHFPTAVLAQKEKIFLDLKKIAAIQLQSMGIWGSHIEISPICTYCAKDLYFSWRRDKPKKLRAMMALIGMEG